MLSVAFSSRPVFFIGIIIVTCLHQSLYIFGMFSSASNFFIKTVKGKEFFGDSPGVLFRFDDGPDPTYTPRILDILKAEGIQALFAVTGKNAATYPELVERMHKEGHIIANHTYSHPYNILLLSYKRVRDEIAKTNELLKDITGEKPRDFCSPMGHKNPAIGRAVKDLGLIPVMWDIRTYDTTAPFNRIMAKIKRKMKSNTQAIIVFHDAIMPWSQKDRESTVLALKETIKIIRDKDYSRI